MTEPEPPYDFYGEALKGALARGARHPELVAAISAHLSESISDLTKRSVTDEIKIAVLGAIDRIIKDLNS
jgi:hypothetical protein